MVTRATIDHVASAPSAAGTTTTHTLAVRKRIALMAHENRRADLLAWARYNRGTLADNDLLATGTTGAEISEALDLPVRRFLSGPLGGDQQVGAAIAEGAIDVVIFFSDPLETHPHDADVKALMRVAVVHNIVIACDRATADFVLSSPLMKEEYVPSFNAEAPGTEASATPRATATP
jgi:methylglyoxal synthase